MKPKKQAQEGRGVPVTSRGLVQRINRALAGKGEMLRSARGAWISETGRYYIVSTKKGVIVQTHVDLESAATKLKVLKAWERLAD